MSEVRRHPFEKTRNGILLFVRLTPKASDDEIVGIDASTDGPRLKVKVRAIPDKGQANSALLKVISKWTGVSRSELTLTLGHKSRLKTVLVKGGDDELAALLEQELKDHS